MRIRLHLFIIAFFLFGAIKAQNITGVWEGIMGDEFLRLSIEQRGDKICGHTYDYILADKNSFCRTIANGNYYAERGIYSFTGRQFIINSGSHVLMAMRLWQNEGEASNYLHGVVGTLSSFGYFSTTDEFYLKKVSSKPLSIPEGFTPCFPNYPPVVKAQPKPKPPVTPTPAPPVAKKPEPKLIPAKPQPTKPPEAKPAPRVVEKALPKAPPADPKSIIVSGQKPVISTNEIRKASEAVTIRKNTEQGRIIISNPVLNLKIYDNGDIDNDTVSVFYNNTLIVNNQRLTDKALEINIPIDTSIKEHVITLFANNLGSIPPNTALIVVTSGNRRYELRSRADLNENAVLVFEYDPPIN